MAEDFLGDQLPDVLEEWIAIFTLKISAWKFQIIQCESDLGISFLVRIPIKSYDFREEIIALLSRNRRISSDLIADVLDQSADNLIDGVTAAQENKYTFAHYYGNRREDGNHLHRDFAQEGGFLCPSEIKYAKPKRGKTAQGTWKDIVNVNDYTQTLRMEKCL